MTQQIELLSRAERAIKYGTELETPRFEGQGDADYADMLRAEQEMYDAWEQR